MSKIKDKLVKDDWKNYNLTEVEQQHLKFIQDAAQRQMGSFLSYVAFTRLGYGDGELLQFDADFNDPKRELKIKVIDQPS